MLDQKNLKSFSLFNEILWSVDRKLNVAVKFIIIGYHVAWLLGTFFDSS